MKKHSENAKSAFIRKTYKARAIPRINDVEVLAQVNKSLVKLWNLALEQCNAWLKMEKNDPAKKTITPISLNFWLTGIRSEYSDIGSVSVVLQREMLRRLAGSFSSYFALLKAKDSRARPPQSKDPEKSFMTLTWTDKSFNLNCSKLTASVGSRVSVEYTIANYIVSILIGLGKYKIAQVTISLKDGEYWISVVCNIPRPEDAKPKGVMAIDLGAGHIAVSCSSGDEFIISARRPDKFWMKKIVGVEARADKCKKDSRAWKRRMGARRTMHNKYQHQHKDHQRKLAIFLVGMSMTIVVGKMRTRLGLAKSGGTPDQHRGAQNTGYHFRQLLFLREKADQCGLRVIEFKDPKRVGEISDPNSKFNAARKLLGIACTNLGVQYPDNFKLIQVTMKQ